jgi:hypothetical protein
MLRTLARARAMRDFFRMRPILIWSGVLTTLVFTYLALRGVDFDTAKRALGGRRSVRGCDARALSYAVVLHLLNFIPYLLLGPLATRGTSLAAFRARRDEIPG